MDENDCDPNCSCQCAGVPDDDPRYVKPTDCDKDGYCIHCGRGAVHRDDCKMSGQVIPEVRRAEMSDWGDALDVVERCLVHWFPELPPSKRRDVAASILGNLTAAGYAEARHES